MQVSSKRSMGEEYTIDFNRQFTCKSVPSDLWEKNILLTFYRHHKPSYRRFLHCYWQYFMLFSKVATTQLSLSSNCLHIFFPFFEFQNKPPERAGSLSHDTCSLFNLFCCCTKCNALVDWKSLISKTGPFHYGTLNMNNEPNRYS